jgi:hypothetical protein
MVRRSLPAGIGALGSAKARFFHPNARIREQWPNDYKRELTQVLVIGEGQRTVNRREQWCYIVRIPEIDDGTEFHIVKFNFTVTTAPETPFPGEERRGPRSRRNQRPAAAAAAEVDPNRVVDRNAVSSVGEGEDAIEELRRQGIEVDDDNEPAPENAEATAPVANGRWEKPTLCPRRMANIPNYKGKFNSHGWEEIAEMNELDQFRMCFPEQFIINVIIPETNKHLGTPVTLQEFYVWLGCIFYMACFEGIGDRDEWWSSAPVDQFKGAPFRLNGFMSKTRFVDIMGALRYTDVQQPILFEDRFHEVRQMIAAFNKHYEKEYSPAWLNCLDESMNSWLNKFCPGFMICPRKPWPFGNEYHSIADSDEKMQHPIMWRVRLVEGKDRPKLGNGRWAFPTQWERNEEGKSKTVELLLDMTAPIHRTGKVVTGDSGFCVAAGVTALHEKGVYGQFLIKKRRYWPKNVPGELIDAHMAGKALGETETYVQELDGHRFLVHCCRDADWTTKIMSCHGVLDENQDHPTWRLIDGAWKSFKYAEPFSRHNKAKHWVDDVNQRRHAPISLESAWGTKWWANRQFTFLLSVAEVNATMARARARKEPTDSVLGFRKHLAKLMLENKLNERGVAPRSPNQPRRASNTPHVLSKREKFEGKYDPDRRVFKRVKTAYLARPCSECRKDTRSYCSCNKSIDLCSACFGGHRREHCG